MAMSKILGNLVSGGKNAAAGWFHSKTQISNTSRSIPHPNGTNLCPTIEIFIANLVKIVDFGKHFKNIYRLTPLPPTSLKFDV